MFCLSGVLYLAKMAHITGSHKQLIAAIEAFISQPNENPKPLRWTKSADDILPSIERFCRRILEVHHRAG